MAQAGLKRGLAAAGLVIVPLAPAACAASSSTAVLPPVQIASGSLLLPTPGPRPKLPDTCGAGALAGLIGRLRTEIPVPVDLSRRRVACTACPVAPDVRLDRVNILYDATTNRVTKITCG